MIGIKLFTILIVLLAAIFVISGPGIAAVQESAPDTLHMQKDTDDNSSGYTANASLPGTLQGPILMGKIVSVDTAKNLLTLKSSSGKYSSFSGDQVNVYLEENIPLTGCNGVASLGDLKAGDRVAISFHETAGLIVADRISEQC